MATALKKFIATTFVESTVSWRGSVTDEFGNIYLDDEVADEV